MSKKPYVGIDGIQRSQKLDEQISLDVAALLATPSGQSVMQYLRSITIEMVNGPNVTTEELRHMEGQRYLVGLIEARMAHAHKVKNNGRKSSK